MKCRHCGQPLRLSLIDLGSAPPSNAYLTREQLKSPEKWFPLQVLVCENCWLAQTEDFSQAKELFDNEYAYFSSFSSTWLTHAESYVENMLSRFALDDTSHVVEVAANDGYLLQYVKNKGIPCTGIEPTASTAAAARKKGITIVQDFFGVQLAESLVRQNKRADLIVANNVLAHVPDINDFISGFRLLLKRPGIATFEFPHLLKLVTGSQFDTIYHEHFSYLSLLTVKNVFAHNGLSIFDVEQLATHGGSLRVYAQRTDSAKYTPTGRLQTLLDSEINAGIPTKDFYMNFQRTADKIKDGFVTFLIKGKETGKKTAAYGAAAKGNTLLNYAGIRPDLIGFVVDRNPAKQGKYLPGSRIPIVDELYLRQVKPDYIVILPWNLKNEIMDQLTYVREWGGRFVIVVPRLEVL